MVPLLVAFAVGCALNLAATPLARALARRVGLVDRPDGRRKLQSAAVPVAGGPALFVAVAAAVAVAALAGGGWGAGVDVRPGAVAGLLAGGLVICGVGVADDAVGLRGRYKLLGQCLAVAVVVGCGVVVERVHLFGWDVELGVLAAPVTGVLLLGAVNALNLLDGMDGLLGSVGLIVCVAFGAMAAWAGQGFAAWVAFATAGALLGFLRYNLPPASVYMGDSGSMLVGLVVGVLAVHGSLKGPAAVALVAPGCVLVVPILDTAAAIARRKLVGRSVFATDRGHLHHCLQRRGLSRRAALLVVAAVGLAGAAGGAVCVAGGSWEGRAWRWRPPAPWRPPACSGTGRRGWCSSGPGTWPGRRCGWPPGGGRRGSPCRCRGRGTGGRCGSGWPPGRGGCGCGGCGWTWTPRPTGSRTTPG
jgi:UDP-GlcNAc:undecaprenyl-phosphate GlcNAc-1-phosphate transferase